MTYGIDNSMNLAQVKKGESAVILRVDAEQSIRERLRMLNVAPGMRIKVIRYSFFKSSMLLESDGLRIGLRRELAEKISVMQREF